jgi:hypothetical protein
MLSDYELGQVKRLLANGFSPNKVARMVGVDIKAVYRVAEGV